MSVINTNITSLIGQSNLSKSQNALQTSMERLSSGLRINSANRMTAEGSLNQVNDNLQSIQDEIDRISEETNFNGVRVLSADDELTIQVGANDGETLGLGDMATTVSVQAVARAQGYEIGGSYPDVSALTAITPTPNEEIEGVTIGANGAPFQFTNTGGGNTDGAELVEHGDNLYAIASTAGAGTGDALTANFTYDGDTSVDLSGLNDFPTTQGGGNAEFVFQDQAGAEVSGYSVLKSGDNYYLKNSDGEFFAASVNQDGDNVVLQKNSDTALTIEEASEAGLNVLADMDRALNSVDSLRSELGAVQNRFEDAITNLNTNETNLAAARSRIEDADYAVEVANMTRAQILQQAGTSVLAQANQIPQNVLSLLG